MEIIQDGLIHEVIIILILNILMRKETENNEVIKNIILIH